MRQNDERALYGLADDDDRPDPASARTAAEFVALLGALVEYSGLSLPEIEELAGSKGYVLPEQIIVTALSHDALPPEELVVALVRSIGINDREVKYWVEALWRLESRAAYNPGSNQEHERPAPRDIDQIYGIKDEPGPAQPYVVPAPYDVGRVPGVDEVYEEPYAVPRFLGAGQVAAAEPRFLGAGQVSDADEPSNGVATGYETVKYDEPQAEAEPVSPATPQGNSEGPQAHAAQEQGERSSWTGGPRHALRDDDDDDDGDHSGDAQLMQRNETRDTWAVRPQRPRIRDLATRPISRVNEKAEWRLPVAVGLSIVLAISVVAWMAFGGNGGGEAPSDAAGAPPGRTQNQTGTGSRATEASASPTASDGSTPSDTPETRANPPANPNNPNPQPTTQGPQPTPTQTRTYSTELTGTGSTICTNEGGQWRVRILVNVTVSDPPPGLVPQGQAGLSGSMQGFSLSGGGSSYSGSATVSVGPSSSPNVGTVQWLVTMSVPGGRIARDESFEGYSCA